MNIIHFILIQVLVFFIGCSSNNNLELTTVDKDLLLVESITQGLTLPTINSLEESVRSIKESAHALCNQNDKMNSFENTQKAWLAAMVQFHRMEVLFYSKSKVAQEELTDLPYIYFPNPNINATEKIELEIEKAKEKQSEYKLRRPKVSLTGLNALENLLYNIIETPESFTPASGECVYLNYTASELEVRVQKFRQLWLSTELEFIESEEGRSRLKEVIGDFAVHIIGYTEKQIKMASLSAPLGLNQEEYSCEDSLDCQQQFLEHPYYYDPKIALKTRLEVLNELFNQGTLKASSTEPQFTFSEYFESKEALKKQNSSLILLKTLDTLSQMPEGRAYIQLFDTPTESNQSIYNILQDMNEFLEWLNVDFLVEINTKLPGTVQNDGD